MNRKTFTALATAGLIAIGGVAVGAGPASAATCPAGQHWNEMGGGAGFCSPDASGGGTGGDIIIDLGGTTPPAPKAPVFTNPHPYQPPVYRPAPAPVRAPVKTVATVAKAGTVLKADSSGWAKGTVLKYRWTRNGATVATTPTYKTRAADKGKTIAVTVTGTKAGHSTTKAAKQYSVR